MTAASAPGKIILFGEHAVVYGQPALAVPVTQVQATATVERSTSAGIWIDAPDVGLASELSHLPLDDPLAAAVRLVLQTLTVSSPPDLKINIRSSIPVASGLGSGAAVSVALVRALSAQLGQPLPDETVSALAYEVEKLHHGTPSGIDNTVITYARPVFFMRGQPVETFQVGHSFTLVIGDTGVASPTRSAVGDVRSLWLADSQRWERAFDQVGAIVRQARQAIAEGRVEALGPLMDANHALLQEMTVTSPELDRLVAAARKAGAPGAKLSGGGRGGNMIALAPPGTEKTIAAALEKAGARRTITTTVA